MQLKHLASGESLTLPDDLLWADEHNWSPVVAASSYLVTGALLIQSATRQSGRPVTLTAEPDMAWIRRSDLTVLYAWAAEPVSETSGRMELTLPGGQVLAVAFRHADGAIEAEPVLGLPARSINDYYRVSLRFIQV